MTVDGAWPITRFIHRASWWVFIVVAVAARDVEWLRWGSQRSVTYHGSYEPLNGVTTTKAYETALDISFDVTGRSSWVDPVTLIAAGLTVIAALVEAVLLRRGWRRSTAIVLAAPVAIVIVAYSLSGIGESEPALWLQVIGLLIAVGVHEGAMAASNGLRRGTRHPKDM